MIYTYGIENSPFEKTDKSNIYRYFRGKEFVQLDCETMGFDVYTKALMCIQIGDFNTQFVIHPSKLQEFKTLLELKTLIGHNIKFDLKFLYHQGIFPNKVWDTFLAESILTCGLKRSKRSLAAVSKARLGVDMNKSVRDTIWLEGLTKRVIEYSADDVKYLEQIKASQEEDIEKMNVGEAIKLDNKFVLVLAYIEYCGIKVDVEKWKKKQIGDRKLVIQRQAIIDNFVIDNKLDKFINKQLDLFSTETTTKINWGSPKQVIELFEEINIPVLAKKKGKMVKTVEAKMIEKYSTKFPFVSDYIAYKEATKVVSTYGDTVLNQISEITGRIHTSFKQILNTGRLSSGGKNKETKESYLNLQNIPSDKSTRACFIPEKGNKLIISDYTAQEDFVFTELSREQKLIEFYNDTTRKRDGHSFVAKMCFPRDLNDIPEDKVKELRPDLRDAAKKAKFAIHYGGNGKTIADNINIPVEEGHEIYEAYMTAFPDIKDYFDKHKKIALENGFIRFNDITNRVSFAEGFDRYKILKRDINRQFWDKWKNVKEAYSKGLRIEEYEEMKDKISTFFKVKGDIEKAALNYRIQGTAADLTKQAGIYFFDWIKKNNYLNIVKIPNTVHDEYVVEAPEDICSEVAKNLQICMEEAADIYVKVVKLKAKPTIASSWSEK